MSDAASDGPEAFKAFEHEGWQTVATEYRDFWGPLTQQAVAPLLEAVGAGPGVRLLDVATGPGYVAATAAERGARAIGVDFSAAMVAEAGRRYPKVTFQEGDAEALDFSEASFDAVTIAFGLLHLARPERALAEAQRVLRPGGKVGYTVWAKPEEAVGFQIVLQAIEKHGNPNVPLPLARPFFYFTDPDTSRQALEAAGFIRPQISKIPQVWRLPSPDTLFEALSTATVRTAGLLRAQSAPALAAIRAAVREGASAFVTATGGVEIPMPAVLASAERPSHP
ncbi:MAG TPA: methyltransferase domain-containing protein [Chthonomonadaceae bacterium]|nr:methyltransferase domain-containing protein [Chthonomonadaceae bacterium]